MGIEIIGESTWSISAGSWVPGFPGSRFFSVGCGVPGFHVPVFDFPVLSGFGDTFQPTSVDGQVPGFLVPGLGDSVPPILAGGWVPRFPENR